MSVVVISEIDVYLSLAAAVVQQAAADFRRYYRTYLRSELREERIGYLKKCACICNEMCGSIYEDALLKNVDWNYIVKIIKEEENSVYEREKAKENVGSEA